MDWLTDATNPRRQMDRSGSSISSTCTFRLVLRRHHHCLRIPDRRNGRHPLDGLHPFVLIAVIAGFVAYLLQRSWKPACLSGSVGLLFISISRLLGRHDPDHLAGDLGDLCAQHGDWRADRHRGGASAAVVGCCLRPILDMMQTIPTFVYLIPALIFFGLGVVAGMVATIIFALPAPIRLTYLGISSAPKQLMEAAESFGATKRQTAVAGGGARMRCRRSWPG